VDAVRAAIVAETMANQIMKWEYRTLLVDAEMFRLIGLADTPLPWRIGYFFEEALNELGCEGWELVGIVPQPSSSRQFAVFKRPLTAA
jgi:hypothetical protein